MKHSNLLLPVSIFLAALFTLGLTGCAGRITKADCEKADFYAMGLEDGQEGKTLDRLAKFQSACTNEGVAVPGERYTYGHQVGLAEHCDASRGRSDARELTKTSICADSKIPPYQKAYNEELAKNKDKITKALADIQETQDDLKKQQEELKAKLDQINGQGAIL